MKEVNTGDIIQKVLEGDSGQFAVLIDAYRSMVYTLCIRMLTNEQDAEEAAQDVFVKAFRSLKNYQGSAAFSTWLYRITYNHCISVIRKKVKLIDLVDDVPDEEVDLSALDPIDALNASMRRKYIERALETLPETDAFVLTLFYYEELSLDEICEATGLSNNNVRIKLHRSRKKIYTVLKALLKSEVNSMI